MLSRPTLIGIIIVLALQLVACDPLLSIQGSFWPPWIVCMLTGVFLTVAFSQLFYWLKLDPYLGHPLLVYPSLWALLTFSTWLLGYAQ